MITFELAYIAQQLDASYPEQNLSFTGIAIDSRRVQAGQLFVALCGEQTDGHRYLAEAASKGAIAALVQQPIINAPLPTLEVTDTLWALGELARLWRKHFRVPVCAVTGSNGKTTTRSMITSICRAHTQHDDVVLCPQGNFNNFTGLPLTLFQLNSTHQYVVLEMGMNHRHEITRLTQIAEPSVGVITNAQAAHIEFLKDVATVAQAKGELFESLPKTSAGIINADDEFSKIWQIKLDPRPCLRFALNTQDTDLSAEIKSTHPHCEFILRSPKGTILVHLPIPGRHNIANALAASAACLAMNIPLIAIKQGLEQMTGVKQRLQSYRHPTTGSLVIDDSYNANPSSTRAALRVLAQHTGTRIFVFGDMKELGPTAKDLHAAIGNDAKQLGIDKVFTLGDLSAATSHAFGNKAQHFQTKSALGDALTALMTPETTVLVKGSRSMQMEQIVEQLMLVGETRS